MLLLKTRVKIVELNLKLIAIAIFSLSTISAQQNSPLFKLLPSSKTGIDFNNQLFESDTLNILNQANIYNGAGVGIADFNNDGLMVSILLPPWSQTSFT